MHLLTLNAAGKPLAPPQTLAPSRRRLSQVIGRHVDRSRPHMIAVQRARDPLQPIEEAWITRGQDAAGNLKPWQRMYLPADAIVVVVYLPRGGMGGGASGGSKKSPLSIALGIASVALIAFAGPLGVAAAGALGLGATAGTIITAGLVLGGTALLGLASRAKANKTPTDTTQVYGVSGGGNAPRPGDRIPRLYGRVWVKPDLSQPDFSQYDGDDQILFKRQTITLGRARVYQARVGKQVVWQEGVGFLAPFNDSRNAIEFIYGTASTLVPNSNVAATGVGGELPRLQDPVPYAGPFLINQRGALITRLQVDFQFPQGISRTDYLKSGTVRSAQPGEWGVQFEYAPIDESGAITGGWQILYSGNSGNEGSRFATHPLRYTKFKDVSAGRYAVRGVNVATDTSALTSGAAHQNAAQWDGASGWVADTAIRPGVSEVCMRIYATKGTQAAAFGELEVDAAAIIPVWNGSAWIEQETSKAVWAFCDIMRSQDYGGALPDSQIDLGTALGYANTLTQFDTFDGLIRGPVSVYEAAATALLPMRAEPVHLGRYWSLVRDEPKAVRRHVITPRQMTKGSTQIVFDLDTAAGAGHVIGEFDDGGDYRNPNQTTAIYGEASLTPTRQRWTGVRTYEHAQHLTRWRAAAGAFRRQTAPFGVEMEGRIYKRGDSILVDPWFIDARRRAGVLSRDGDTLTIDADIDVQANEAAIFRDRTGRAWGPVVLLWPGPSRELRLDGASRAQVEQTTGQSLASILSDGRREMTTVLVGPVSSLAENYLIQSVKPSGPDKAQVEALIDDPRVWAAIGAPIVVPPEGAAGLKDPESPRVVGLTANAVQVAAGLRCDYAIQPGRGAVSFEIGISYDDGNRFDTRPNAPITGSIDLNPVDPQNVVLRARAFGSTGLPGPYFLAELGLPSAELGITLPPIAYVDLDTAVQAQIDRIEGIKQEADLAIANAAEARSTALAKVADLQTSVTSDFAGVNSRADAIRLQAVAAAAAATAAMTDAQARLDQVRKALSYSPAIRQQVIDPIIGDLRADLDILTQSATRNIQEVTALRDALSTAGLELLPDQGIVRFYAIEALRTQTTQTISNFSITVDALSKKIDLYGSVQQGDLSGLITQITTVQTQLNALSGTITNTVSTATFNQAVARISTAETRLDANAAEISARATTATVNAQGTRLTQAEQTLSAVQGLITQTVASSSSSQIDLGQIPRTIAGFFDLLQRQQGALQQTVAFASESLGANVDAAGRATAEVRTQLGVFSQDASAQFTTLTRTTADTSAAVATQQTQFSARFASNEATLTQEITTRTTQNAATTSQLTGALSRLGSAEAAITSETTTRAAADSAATTRIDSAVTRIGAAESSITSVYNTLAGVDLSLSQRIDTTVARLGTAEGSVTSEVTARASADTALGQRIDVVSARTGTNEASITAEVAARVTAVSAQASRIDSLNTSVAGNIVAIASETTARSTADGALGTRIDGLSASVGSNSAAITEEARVRADAVSTQAQRITSLTTQTNSDRAYFLSEQQTRQAVDGNLASNLTALGTRVGTNEAAIVSEASARSTADGSLSQRIDSLSATVGPNSAAIAEEARVRADAVNAQAQRITSLITQTDADRAYFLAEQVVRSSKDEEYGSSINAAVARLGTAEASLATEISIRSTQYETISSSLTQINAKSDQANAGVANEASARVAGDQANASSINDLYGRSDYGTAYGRFSAEVQSGPGGVSARIALQVSTDSYSGRRNAGIFLDAMSDGSSRVILDANLFAITANGGVTYPFTFDGQTLTIPSLRVTQSIMLPGAASDSRKSFVQNYTAPAITGDTWVEVPGSEVYFTVDHVNGFPVVATVYADLYVQLINGSSTIMTASIETAIAIDGNPWNNRNTVFTSTSAGNASGFSTSNSSNSGGTIGNTMMAVVGPGNHRFSIMYKFKGPASGAGARINVGQIDALISKR